MKRKNTKRKPMQLVINEKIREVLEDPYTMHYLAARLIRPRPRKKLFTFLKGKEKERVIYLVMPWLIWKALLWIVLAPAAKERPNPEIEKNHIK